MAMEAFGLYSVSVVDEVVGSPRECLGDYRLSLFKQTFGHIHP
jgi:hypothetical protein